MFKHKRNRKQDTSWIWMCSLLAIFFIGLIVCYGRACLRSNGAALNAQNTLPEIELTEYNPPTLKSLIVHPESTDNYFDFILDTQQDAIDDEESLEPLAKELIDYFFLGITLPSDDLWVNLNSVQESEITSPRLALTDIGKVLLEADLTLKQDCSRFTDPRTKTGKEYWDNLQRRLNEEGLNTTQLPIGNRFWIIPLEAAVEEDVENNTVTIVRSRLKVCLEQEYLKLTPQNRIIASSSPLTPKQLLTQQICDFTMKETILPHIQERVNQAEEYAKLRQVYNSLILAEYYKQKYHNGQGLYPRLVNRGYIEGLESTEPWNSQDFYQAYVKSAQEGEYRFSQQEYDPFLASMVKKYYFYGGVFWREIRFILNTIILGQDEAILRHSRLANVSDNNILARLLRNPNDNPWQNEIDVHAFSEERDSGRGGLQDSFNYVKDLDSPSVDKRQEAASNLITLTPEVIEAKAQQQFIDAVKSSLTMPNRDEDNVVRARLADALLFLAPNIKERSIQEKLINEVLIDVISGSFETISIIREASARTLCAIYETTTDKAIKKRAIGILTDNPIPIEPRALPLKAKILPPDYIAEQIGGKLKEAKKMLVPVRGGMGLGDEIIQSSMIITAALEAYPNLEITVCTQRPYLYEHPRIKVIGMGEAYYFDILLPQLMDASYYIICPCNASSHRMSEIMNNNPRAIIVGEERTTTQHVIHVDGENFFIYSSGTNVYDPTIDLIRSFGLNIPQDSSSILINRESEEFTQVKEWLNDHHIEPEPLSRKRPLIIFNGFGGESERKGFRSMIKLASCVKAILDKGDADILITKNVRCTAQKEMELIRALKGLIHEGTKLDRVKILPAAEVAGQGKWMKNFIYLSDAVITIEGTMMHLAQALNKPYLAVMSTKLAGSKGYFPPFANLLTQKRVVFDKHLDNINTDDLQNIGFETWEIVDKAGSAGLRGDDKDRGRPAQGGGDVDYRIPVDADWSQVFEDNIKPIMVEVGFGKGEKLVEMARNHPEFNYIGIEIQTPTDLLNTRLNQGEEPVKNLRLISPSDSRAFYNQTSTGIVSEIYYIALDQRVPTALSRTVDFLNMVDLLQAGGKVYISSDEELWPISLGLFDRFRFKDVTQQSTFPHRSDKYEELEKYNYVFQKPFDDSKDAKAGPDEDALPPRQGPEKGRGSTSSPSRPARGDGDKKAIPAAKGKKSKLTSEPKTWVTGLWNLEQCKEAYKQFLEDRKSVSKWRLRASLAALSSNKQSAFVRWAETLRLGDTVEIARTRARRNIRIGKTCKYMPACELWEALIDFLDKDLEATDRNEEERQLWLRVLEYAEINRLLAHGTMNFKGFGIYSDEQVIEYQLSHHWALLNIMIEGKITRGDISVLDTDIDSPGRAARYGPYYVVPDAKENHVIYLVPREEAAIFLKRGLEEAIKLDFITYENAKEALSKVMTYQQFVDNHEHIKDIVEGRIKPAELTGPRDDSRGRPAREAGDGRLMPLEQLTWQDKEGVLGHFKALLAELGWPLPRVMVKDGEVVEQIKVAPLTIEKLRNLAVFHGYASPSDYYKNLRDFADTPGISSVAYTFQKEFGILSSWVVWFRYYEQLESIRNYVDTLPKDKTTKILVHATWNGEDAYAIAVMLDYLYPDRTFEIVGVDFTEPNPDDLNWAAVKRVPEFLKGAINKYFSYKTDSVIALKGGLKGLVTVRQGDIRKLNSFDKGLDVVVANGVLGQSITKIDDIIQSIENAWVSLVSGGRFYVDNSAYKANPDQRLMVEEVLKEEFVKKGKFVIVEDAVYEKTGAAKQSSIFEPAKGEPKVGPDEDALPPRQGPEKGRGSTSSPSRPARGDGAEDTPGINFPLTPDFIRSLWPVRVNNAEKTIELRRALVSSLIINYKDIRFADISMIQDLAEDNSSTFKLGSLNVTCFKVKKEHWDNTYIFSIAKDKIVIGHGIINYFPDEGTVRFRYGIHGVESVVFEHGFRYENGKEAMGLIMAMCVNGRLFGDAPVNKFQLWTIWGDVGSYDMLSLSSLFKAVGYDEHYEFSMVESSPDKDIHSHRGFRPGFAGLRDDGRGRPAGEGRDKTGKTDNGSDDHDMALLNDYFILNPSTRKIDHARVRRYYKFLKAVKNEVDQLTDSAVVYAPGIGPHYQKLDIISALIATDYSHLIGSDNQEVSFADFQSFVKASLVPIGSEIENLIFPEPKKPYCYEAQFTYKRKARRIRVYFNFDAQRSTPEEKFNIIYLRRPSSEFKLDYSVWRDWIERLQKRRGFLVTPRYFINNNTDVNLSKKRIFDQFLRKIPLGEIGKDTYSLEEEIYRAVGKDSIKDTQGPPATHTKSGFEAGFAGPRDDGRPAQGGKGASSVSAEEVFSRITNKDKNKILAAKMIDELKIGEGDNVLCIGPRTEWSHPVACAIRGAQVDILQPNRYGFFDQETNLTKAISRARNKIRTLYGRDIIGTRIDTKSYANRIELANLPFKHYSHIFLLNVLDDHIAEGESLFAKAGRANQVRIIDSALSAAEDNSTIIYSSVLHREDKQIDLLKTRGHLLGYNINEVRSFEGGKYFAGNNLTVYELRVHRLDGDKGEPKVGPNDSALSRQGPEAPGPALPSWLKGFGGIDFRDMNLKTEE